MISVCMATHNGERFIREQIVSILRQLGPMDEVVVSDDSSTDGTTQVLRSLSDGRIRILHHQPRRITDNFENALKSAKGDYIYLADQDDIWVDGRVAAVQARLEAGVALVTVDAKMVDGDGRVIGESFFKVNGVRRGLVGNIAKNSFPGCCMAFRREVLDLALPFPAYTYMHDWWIALVTIAHRLPYEFLNVPYHIYRRHGENATGSGCRSRLPCWTRLYNRMTLVLPLVLRYWRNRFRFKGALSRCRGIMI